MSFRAFAKMLPHRVVKEAIAFELDGPPFSRRDFSRHDGVQPVVLNHPILIRIHVQVADQHRARVLALGGRQDFRGEIGRIGGLIGRRPVEFRWKMNGANLDFQAAGQIDSADRVVVAFRNHRHIMFRKSRVSLDFGAGAGHKKILRQVLV